eukprot:gene3030-2012_t
MQIKGILPALTPGVVKQPKLVLHCTAILTQSSTVIQKLKSLTHTQPMEPKHSANLTSKMRYHKTTQAQIPPLSTATQTTGHLYPKLNKPSRKPTDLNAEIKTYKMLPKPYASQVNNPHLQPTARKPTHVKSDPHSTRYPFACPLSPMLQQPKRHLDQDQQQAPLNHESTNCLLTPTPSSKVLPTNYIPGNPKSATNIQHVINYRNKSDKPIITQNFQQNPKQPKATKPKRKPPVINPENPHPKLMISGKPLNKPPKTHPQRHSQLNHSKPSIHHHNIQPLLASKSHHHQNTSKPKITQHDNSNTNAHPQINCPTPNNHCAQPSRSKSTTQHHIRKPRERNLENPTVAHMASIPEITVQKHHKSQKSPTANPPPSSTHREQKPQNNACQHQNTINMLNPTLPVLSQNLHPQTQITKSHKHTTNKHLFDASTILPLPGNTRSNHRFRKYQRRCTKLKPKPNTEATVMHKQPPHPVPNIIATVNRQNYKNYSTQRYTTPKQSIQNTLKTKQNRIKDAQHQLQQAKSPTYPSHKPNVITTRTYPADDHLPNTKQHGGAIHLRQPLTSNALKLSQVKSTHSDQTTKSSTHRPPVPKKTHAINGKAHNPKTSTSTAHQQLTKQHLAYTTHNHSIRNHQRITDEIKYTNINQPHNKHRNNILSKTLNITTVKPNESAATTNYNPSRVKLHVRYNPSERTCLNKHTTKVPPPKQSSAAPKSLAQTYKQRHHGNGPSNVIAMLKCNL